VASCRSSDPSAHPRRGTSIERWARARLNLKPGITGLGQVLGASDIPFDEMTKLDYLHVTNWSLAADMRLLLPSFTRARSAC
jgi:lipopolysaccharide/colanic/teichoic acid biosynthesis glycosyltransferase